MQREIVGFFNKLARKLVQFWYVNEVYTLNPPSTLKQPIFVWLKIKLQQMFFEPFCCLNAFLKKSLQPRNSLFTDFSCREWPFVSV